MKIFFMYLLTILFAILLFCGIWAQLIFNKQVPHWVGYVTGVELFISFWIVLAFIQKWVMKIMDIKQHEL